MTNVLTPIKADYYQVAQHDHRRLCHETPEEAIAEYLDEQAELNEPIMSLIERLSPIEVRAFDKSVCDDAWIQEMARCAMVHVKQSFDETLMFYDNGDTIEDDPSTKHVLDEVEIGIARSLEPLKRLRTSACESVGSMEYDADDVELIMREMEPSYFDESDRDNEAVLTPSGSDDTAAIASAVAHGRTVRLAPAGAFSVNATMPVIATGSEGGTKSILARANDCDGCEFDLDIEYSTRHTCQKFKDWFAKEYPEETGDWSDRNYAVEDQ